MSREPAVVYAAGCVLFAVAAALVIAALSALHVYWGAGGRWPGESDADLATRVVGTTVFPSALACFAVAAALVAAASLVVLAAFAMGGPLVRWGAWAVCAVFALRGTGGFFDAMLRPGIREHPYHRANLRYYSPLCLVVAALVAAALLPSIWI